MAAGTKTGGRAKGTPNKPRTAPSVDTDVAASVATAPAPAAAPAAVSEHSRARPRERPSPDIEEGPKLPRYRLTPVDQLVQYANNPRTHSPAQIDKLAASIREFGFTNPILTDGKRGIIAGHGRLLAARILAMDAVPTIELAHLSAAQRRAYVIADNRLALDAGWDDALLALELGELRAGGFDLALTGFDAGELDLLLPDPDDLPGSEPEARAKPSVVCPSCNHTFVP